MVLVVLTLHQRTYDKPTLLEVNDILSLSTSHIDALYIEEQGKLKPATAGNHE